MSTAVIMGFLKALLPTKRIAAWILGVIGAALALFMGVNNAELKTQFCASEPVQIPKIEAPAAAPAPAVVPDPALQNLPPAPKK
jgi:hypothetical protein